MKKLGLLLALATIAGSASATIVLNDAQWATAWTGGANPCTTYDGSVDVAGDPGYEFTVTAAATEDWGWGLNIGYQDISAWKFRVLEVCRGAKHLGITFLTPP